MWILYIKFNIEFDTHYIVCTHNVQVYNVRSTKIILVHPKCKKNGTLTKWLISFIIDFYLFSCRSSNKKKKLLLLTSLLYSLYQFSRSVNTSFLHCFQYSYRFSNYCDSNSLRSFTLLKAISKRERERAR